MFAATELKEVICDLDEAGIEEVSVFLILEGALKFF